jgi:predicted TIM-barrel fold metal-dependent hydrolase
MQTVDAQIHTWGSGLPSNQSHIQVMHFTPAEAIALMDEAGVDAAVIHPPGWDPGSTEMALKAVRTTPAASRSWGRCRSIARNPAPALHAGETSRGCSACAMGSSPIRRGAG